MGTQYSTRIAYGAMFTNEELIELASSCGYKPPAPYQSILEAVQSGDFEYDFIMWYAHKMGTDYCIAGNSYWDDSGSVVFGDSICVWGCDFGYVDLERINCVAVDAACARVGMNAEWFIGSSVG